MVVRLFENLTFFLGYILEKGRKVLYTKRVWEGREIRGFHSEKNETVKSVSDIERDNSL